MNVRTRGSLISIVIRLRVGRPRFVSRQTRKGVFLFATASILALGPSSLYRGGGLAPGCEEVRPWSSPLTAV